MSAHLPDFVRIVEVGPRDGLQNEKTTLDAATKIAFVKALVAAGLRDIEVTSFVRPDRVPQLADAREVWEGVRDETGARLWALVPNERGLERARAVGVTHVAVFTAASDGFNHANINAGVDEALERLRPVIAQARELGMTVRGYVSTVFGCPYDGIVDPQRAAGVSRALYDAGCTEISLGDTIGVAVPLDIVAAIEAHEAAGIPRQALALHLHDTHGTGLANVYEGLRQGITTFDAAAGGLGGCPFAKGATGNLATEDLLYLLEQSDIESGVSLDAVAAASGAIGVALDKTLVSRARAARVGGL